MTSKQFVRFSAAPTETSKHTLMCIIDGVPILEALNMPSENVSLVFVSITDSEDKTPQPSLTHHAASSRANQSQTEVTDNEDEPIGDRWDEEEDWGSLEVGLYNF